MKMVTHGNLKQKFDKKKMYLIHYQLLEHMEKGKGVMFRANLFIFAGFYLVLHKYPLTLASLDFSFTVLSLIFLFWLKPKMLRGEITAYYRRDYRKMKGSMFFIQLFIQGGIMRFLVLLLYYGVALYLVRNNSVELAQYKEVIFQILVNPLMMLVALAGFALAIYLVFYHEKYVTIREFSNSVMEIYSSYPYTEEGAVKEFISRKDRQFHLLDVDGVRYDGVWSTPSYVEPSQTEPIAVEAPSVYEPQADTVRRKARR